MTGPPPGVPAFSSRARSIRARAARTIPIARWRPSSPHRSARAPHPCRAGTQPAPLSTLPWLGDVAAGASAQALLLGEAQESGDPNSATEFYLTVDGTDAQAVRSGGRAAEHRGQARRRRGLDHREPLHRAARIPHSSVAFSALDWSGVPVNEPFLRDTVNVPYFNGRDAEYPSVRLRMDFRDPNTVGTFVYHCHLLEHEDGGMMGIIRVTRRATLRGDRYRSQSATPTIISLQHASSTIVTHAPLGGKSRDQRPTHFREELMNSRAPRRDCHSRDAPRLRSIALAQLSLGATLASAAQSRRIETPPRPSSTSS